MSHTCCLTGHVSVVTCGVSIHSGVQYWREELYRHTKSVILVIRYTLASVVKIKILFGWENTRSFMKSLENNLVWCDRTNNDVQWIKTRVYMIAYLCISFRVSIRISLFQRFELPWGVSSNEDYWSQACIRIAFHCSKSCIYEPSRYACSARSLRLWFWKAYYYITYHINNPYSDVHTAKPRDLFLTSEH